MNTDIMTSRFYCESSDDDVNASAKSDDIETGKSDFVKSEYENTEIHDVSPHPINELVESHSKKRKAYTRRTGNKIARLTELQHYVDVLHIFD